MRRQDWLILSVLLAAALWFGWPRIQEMPIVRTLSGECATPRSCPPPGEDWRAPLPDPGRGLRRT